MNIPSIPSIPSIIFIVPYRDRENQKQLFEIYMKYLLEDYSPDKYEIYFAHQCDKRPFNRGANKNIGFLAMKEKYPNHYHNITFVFNDIDTMPYKKNILNYEITDEEYQLYNNKQHKGLIKHFYGFTFSLGGIFSIKGKDFESINGFPNYWGWGLEDNMMQKRAEKYFIDRSNFYPIHSKSILQIHDDIKRLISNRQPAINDMNNQFLYHDGLSTISNLKYNIDNNNNNNISSIINITNFDLPNKPEDDRFFYQDLSKSSKLMDRRLEKTQQRFGLVYY